MPHRPFLSITDPVLDAHDYRRFAYALKGVWQTEGVTREVHDEAASAWAKHSEARAANDPSWVALDAIEDALDLVPGESGDEIAYYHTHWRTASCTDLPVPLDAVFFAEVVNQDERDLRLVLAEIGTRRHGDVMGGEALLRDGQTPEQIAVSFVSGVLRRHLDQSEGEPYYRLQRLRRTLSSLWHAAVHPYRDPCWPDRAGVAPAKERSVHLDGVPPPLRAACGFASSMVDEPHAGIAIQRGLKDAGHDVRVDGLVGEETRRALRQMDPREGTVQIVSRVVNRMGQTEEWKDRPACEQAVRVLWGAAHMRDATDATYSLL